MAYRNEDAWEKEVESLKEGNRKLEQDNEYLRYKITLAGKIKSVTGVAMNGVAMVAVVLIFFGVVGYTGYLVVKQVSYLININIEIREYCKENSCKIYGCETNEDKNKVRLEYCVVENAHRPLSIVICTTGGCVAADELAPRGGETNGHYRGKTGYWPNRGDELQCTEAGLP